MAQSLLAIAAFLALIGSVIFGVSRYEKSAKEENEIELVRQSIEPQPVVAESVESMVAETSVVSVSEPAAEESVSEPVVAAIAEPMVTEPVAEPIEVVESEPIQEPVQEAVEVVESEPVAEPVQEAVEVATAIEPRDEVEEILIPPTIQDPKRPNDGGVEDLTQTILAWGQSKDLKHVAQLMQYSTHADPIVRSHVATALGQIMGAHAVRGDVERSIPVLGKLTNDSDLKVRQYAVQALGMIRSEQVLPYLEKALLSPSGSVMKAANSALQNLKLQYGKPPSVEIAMKMLEKVDKKTC